MNKILSAKTLLIVSIFFYTLSYIVGGIYGEGLGLIGFITLCLSIVNGIKDLIDRKKKNN